MSDTSVRYRYWTLLGALASVCLAGACRDAGKDVGPDVWAVVDDREIRREEVEKAYRRVVEPAPTPPSDDEVMTVKLGLVDELVNQDILTARARANGLEVSDADLDKAFAERKGNVPEDAFQQQLRTRGLTSDELKDALRRELLVQKLVDRDVDSKIVISDQDISDFYNKNRAQFNVAETQYRIAQIVITPVREPQLRNRTGDDAATPVDAQRKAQMLMDRLKNGADFAALAMDYSEDPRSAPQGGDLGFVSTTALGQVPAALRNAVLKSEPGNVNVVSAGGAHTLVLLVAREQAGQRELSSPAVRDGITTMLRQRKQQLLRAAYIAAARNDAKVVNHLARQLVQKHSQLPGLLPAPGK